VRVQFRSLCTDISGEAFFSRAHWGVEKTVGPFTKRRRSAHSAVKSAFVRGTEAYAALGIVWPGHLVAWRPLVLPTPFLFAPVGGVLRRGSFDNVSRLTTKQRSTPTNRKSQAQRRRGVRGSPPITAIQLARTPKKAKPSAAARPNLDRIHPVMRRREKSPISAIFFYFKKLASRCSARKLPSSPLLRKIAEALSMERDAQSCNQCWRPVSGTICKTSCNHLFCEVRSNHLCPLLLCC
jgi:hypothetical protein